MDVLDEIVRFASARRLVAITYQKPQEPEPTKRCVEPYVLQESGPNLMIRCWQVKPGISEGVSWRTFRVDRIKGVEDAGSDFAPRRKITIADGVLEQFRITRQEWLSEPLNRYQQVVEEIVLDGRLTAEETEAAFEAACEISIEQKRAVHARVYANALIEVALDGEVDEDEAEYVQRLRSFLGALGWKP